MKEKIECQECHDLFTNITTHLIRKHGLSAKEYVSKYPGAKLVSDAFRTMQSQQMKTRYQRGDLDSRAIAGSRTFDFINSKELRLLLQRDYKSAKVCLVHKLYKPCIVLYGSIFEAILIEKTHEKTFSDSLEAAYKDNDISEKEYHKIHIVRNLRNFVHLHKELSEGEEINEYWAKTFADICESIIKRFRKGESYKD